MSRTVSARIPKDLHEELRERCNLVGESMNDFVKAAIEFALYSSSDFDFGYEFLDVQEESTKLNNNIHTESKPNALQNARIEWHD